MLLIMCAFVCYGGIQFYGRFCNVSLSEGQNLRIIVKMKLNDSSILGLWFNLVTVGSCNAWIGWVLSNAFLHMAWVDK